MRSGDEVLAAIGLARDDGTVPVAEDDLPLLTNLLDQVALALVRAGAEAESREVAGLRERDHLRSALLSSVGHDLRTPLTGIIGAAAELRADGAKDPALLATIECEAGKLERYISNLLDMARIEAGAVKLKTEPVDLVDSVAAAIRDVRASLADHPVAVDLPDNLPLIRADAELLHHCLINLIDNAARYSRADGPVRIAAAASKGEVRLRSKMKAPACRRTQSAPWTRSARISGSDRKGGAGLGLAIVKAFAEAMGSKVLASNRDGVGAVFTLVFPKALVLKASEIGRCRLARPRCWWSTTSRRSAPCSRPLSTAPAMPSLKRQTVARRSTPRASTSPTSSSSISVFPTATGSSW